MAGLMTYNFDSHSSPDGLMRFSTEVAMGAVCAASPAVSEMGMEQQFIDVMREASPLLQKAIPAWLKFGDMGVSGDDRACV